MDNSGSFCGVGGVCWHQVPVITRVQVVAEVHGDVMQDDWDHLIDRSKDDREWKNVDGTILLTPTDFSQETYHDLCIDLGKVGAALTAYVQHCDLMEEFRSDKARTNSYEKAYQTQVRKVIKISDRKTPKSMSQFSDVRARFWDNWDTADDTLDFFKQLRDRGIELRKKNIVARRLFIFNRTHRASYNSLGNARPYIKLGDYEGAPPSLGIKAVPGFFKLPESEQQYILSKPFQDRVIHHVEQHSELRDEFIRDDPNLTSEASKGLYVNKKTGTIYTYIYTYTHVPLHSLTHNNHKKCR